MVAPKPIKASGSNGPTKKLFKVNKIFAQWVVPLTVEEGDDNNSLLQKAMKEINNRRIIPTRPENDLVLEELK